MDFKGGNSTSTRTNFIDRKKYKEAVKIEGVDFIDTWYEKPNYGLLNSKFEPVYLNVQDAGLTLRNFEGVTDLSVRALPFVVKAFDVFRSAYNDVVDNTRLSYPKFLESLAPVKAHINLDSVYESYIDSYITQTLELLQQSAAELKTFDQVMEKTLELFELNIKDFPVSRSGFLLSDICPANVSGLCIELANLSYSEDSIKGEIIQSKDFQCFAENANAAGFYVDKNAPWRLIANLESDIMKEEIKKYQNNTTVENTLDRLFRMKTQYQDIYDVANIFSIIHDRFVEANPYIYKDGVIVKPRKISGDLFTEKTWIRLTLMVRSAELGISRTEAEEYLPHVEFVHDMLSSRYTENKLKPAAGEISIFCTERIRQIYESRGTIDSYKKTTIKDYL
jgi:hypothetical protein